MPQSPRETSTNVPGAFYVVSASSELREKPKEVELFGKPLVLFRHANGVSALENRCPHRNVPLSEGRVRGTNIECPYHGWQFDPKGRCQRIPGLAQTPPRAMRTLKTVPQVPHFPVVEESGYLWVWANPRIPRGAEAPFPFPHLQDPDYATIRQVLDLDGTVHSVAENALDVPHTAFLHGGLFRSAEPRQTIEVKVRRGPRGVEAEYIGESRPEGLLGRLLAPNGGVVNHWDRFFLPGIAQVEYRLGEDAHLVATTALTPITAERTRLWGTVSYRLRNLPPALARLAGELIKPLALAILRQDARILRAQSRTIARFGGLRFSSTEIDVLGPSIAKQLRQLEELGKLPKDGGLEPLRTLTMSV